MPINTCSFKKKTVEEWTYFLKTWLPMRTYLKRKEVIDNLFDEIKIIKKLRV